MVGPRLPLGEDLIVGHVHARGAADTEGSSLSPRIKRRIRAKTSLAEIERRKGVGLTSQDPLVSEH